MNTSKIRKILVGLLVLGALSAALSTGTFATFNATTTNSSGITTAVLVMGNKVNSNAECFSSGSTAPTGAITAANSQGCGSVFSGQFVSGTADTTLSSTVAIRNVGNYTNAPTLTLTSSACTNSAAGYTDPTSGVTFAGTGNLCTGLPISVKDTTSGTCIYGANPGTTCDPQGSISAFITALGAGYTVAVPATNTESFLFKVVVPASLDNTYQGRSAAFTITWALQ